MPTTLVAYPHPNDVGHNFHKSLLDLMVHDGGRHVGQVADLRCSTGGIDDGRNTIVRGLLASEFEWLLMVDADMGFAPDALDLLHAVADPVDRPIVGGLCFAQRDNQPDGCSGYQWAAKPTIFDFYDHDDGVPRYTYRHHYPVNALLRCDATGGAFVLIHRSVFERIGDQWFTRVPDHQGGMMSEDLSFFVRCRDAGIPCHVFTGVRTNHHKSVWVSEADFWAEFNPPPAVERVDVIVPVLHRPQNVAPFMATLRASTGLATAWFVCDRADKAEQDEVLANGGRVLKCDGSFAEKVNYAYGKMDQPAPWMFLVGDDVQFHAAWLDHALFVAGEYDASVVGTNDLGNPRVVRGDHATHLLIRRSYVDERGGGWDGPGVVCGPYRHWYVDDEIVMAARQRGAWQMALGSIVEHMHPLWGKGADDDVYRLGQASGAADKALFESRLAASREGAPTRGSTGSPRPSR